MGAGALTTRSRWLLASAVDTGVYGRMTALPPSPIGALGGRERWVVGSEEPVRRI